MVSSFDKGIPNLKKKQNYLSKEKRDMELLKSILLVLVLFENSYGC